MSASDSVRSRLIVIATDTVSVIDQRRGSRDEDKPVRACIESELGPSRGADFGAKVELIDDEKFIMQMSNSPAVCKSYECFQVFDLPLKLKV